MEETVSTFVQDGSESMPLGERGDVWRDQRVDSESLLMHDGGAWILVWHKGANAPILDPRALVMNAAVWYWPDEDIWYFWNRSTWLEVNQATIAGWESTSQVFSRAVEDFKHQHLDATPAAPAKPHHQDFEPGIPPQEIFGIHVTADSWIYFDVRPESKDFDFVRYVPMSEIVQRKIVSFLKDYQGIRADDMGDAALKDLEVCIERLERVSR